MTEAEWLACEDPTPMLDYLGGNASERKFRLFACTCCRQAWHVLNDIDCREAVKTAESFADGMVDESALIDVRGKLSPLSPLNKAHVAAAYSAWVPSENHLQRAGFVMKIKLVTLATRFAVSDAEAKSNSSAADFAAMAARDSKKQVSALLCIFGNPLRPVGIDPHWFTWNSGAIPKLAQTIYEERAFDRMLALAEALTETGCTNADMLAHCRSGGEHVRGCWVVDLLLGKE
jgi:hypothetical protein